MSPSAMLPGGKEKQHLEGCCGPATEASGCKDHRCLVLLPEGIHMGIVRQCPAPESFIELAKRHSLTKVPQEGRWAGD